MRRDKIFLCEGVSKDGKDVCPLRNNCAFYCPTMDKTKTDHFAWMPYKKGKCDEYEQIDLDFNEFNINSHAD